MIMDRLQTVSCLLLFAVLHLNVSVISSQGGQRIIGGYDTKPGEIPYQVSLAVYHGDISFSHICGGAIIGNRTILTAAHCAIEMVGISRFFRIGVGVTDLRRLNYTYSIQDVIVHQKYKRKKTPYDIALLKLNKDIRFDQFTKPIGYSSSTPPDGTQCTISGWGSTKDGVQNVSMTLKAAQVRIVNVNECKRNYSNVGHADIRESSMICAADPQFKRDTCQGDSGGPMVCNNVVVGVVSFGTGCARSGYPGIYTNVAYFKDWLERGGAQRTSTDSWTIVLSTLLTFALSKLCSR